MSAGIVWILLDYLAYVDNLSNLYRTDHTLRSCYLLHGMGQKQDFNGCCPVHLLQDTDLSVHRGYSMADGLLVQQELWEGRTLAVSGGPQAPTRAGRQASAVARPLQCEVGWGEACPPGPRAAAPRVPGGTPPAPDARPAFRVPPATDPHHCS